MAKIYHRKILNGEINPATDEAWTIDDVPERWRAEVEEMFDGKAD